MSVGLPVGRARIGMKIKDLPTGGSCVSREEIRQSHQGSDFDVVGGEWRPFQSPLLKAELVDTPGGGS
jgi:hypothetical protein